MNTKKIDSLFCKYKNFTLCSEQKFKLNLQLLSKNIFSSGVVVECGVWKGGMIAAIAELMGNDFSYFLFDGFNGMPLPSAEDGELASKWYSNNELTNEHNNLLADMIHAEAAMELSECKNYKIIKGSFDKVFPNVSPLNNIVLLRIDCDWYNSTLLSLEYFYNCVLPNGIIILDDYYSWDGTTKAIHEFLYRNNIPDRIQQLNNKVAYIVKGYSSNIYKK